MKDSPVEEKVVDEPFDAFEARVQKFLDTAKEDIKRWDAAAEAKAEAATVDAPAPEVAPVEAQAPAPEALQAAEGDGRAAAEGGDVA